MSNPYPLGQCTYYVASIYPDIPADMGDGHDWIASAERHHYTTSNTPRAGWVVAYSSSYPGSGGHGHVAVVQAVGTDGTFTLKEMNFRAWNVVDERTESASHPYILGYFNPPGGPVSTAALPVGLGVQTVAASSPGNTSSSSSIWDTLFGTILNGLLVIGGTLIMAGGIVLGVFETSQIQPVLDRQAKSIRELGTAGKDEYRANVKRRRETRPKPVEGFSNSERRASKASILRAYGKRPEEVEARSRSTEKETPLSEIPF